jgi:hypothetical protein
MTFSNGKHQISSTIGIPKVTFSESGLQVGIETSLSLPKGFDTHFHLDLLLNQIKEASLDDVTNCYWLLGCIQN